MPIAELTNVAIDARKEQQETRATAISVRALKKSFGDTPVLSGIDFDIAEGESLVLLGASGSGKTTILRIIAGLEEPNSGQIVLHGRDVTRLPARERSVGVIFQSYALFPRMTVADNIGYGLLIRNRPKAEIKETVARLLSLINLTEHRNKYPGQLSGGQQQRVAIARALAYRPEVLLFDEPFGALDAQTRMRLRREIRALLRQVNVPALFITHDQEEALEMGDRIAVLNGGMIEQIDRPAEIYNHPQTEYVATFIGAANLLLGVINSDGVEIGSTKLASPADTARFTHGQAVKLIFRPEDTIVTDAKLPDNCAFLANGIVEEASFFGTHERLMIRLDQTAKQRHSTEPSIGVPVLATRVKSAAFALPLNPGDRVKVGVTSFNILPNFTLSSERASRMI